jgi:hypothetical protein
VIERDGSSKSAPLPRRIRIVSVLCLVFTGLVGAAAASEAMTMARLDETRASLDELVEATPAFADRALTRRMWESELALLHGMRDSRAAFLTGLAICCALCFVATARVLRPNGLPREGMRRMAVLASAGAAIFRTLDGAQMAVVRSHSKHVFEGWLPPGGLPPEVDRDVFERFMQLTPVAGAIAFTAFVSGTLLLFSQFFRSQKVRDAVAP